MHHARISIYTWQVYSGYIYADSHACSRTILDVRGCSSAGAISFCPAGYTMVVDHNRICSCNKYKDPDVEYDNCACENYVHTCLYVATLTPTGACGRALRYCNDTRKAQLCSDDPQYAKFKAACAFDKIPLTNLLSPVLYQPAFPLPLEHQ